MDERGGATAQPSGDRGLVCANNNQLKVNLFLIITIVTTVKTVHDKSFFSTATDGLATPSPHMPLLLIRNEKGVGELTLTQF